MNGSRVVYEGVILIIFDSVTGIAPFPVNYMLCHHLLNHRKWPVHLELAIVFCIVGVVT